MDAKTLKIHGLYIISFLILLNIAIVTFKWGDNQLLIGYISFAGTISSILLAVIAIIYSFYSNSSLTNSLGTLNSISKEFVENSNSISEATKHLEKKIEELPSLLRPIEEKADLTNAKLDQISIFNKKPEDIQEISEDVNSAVKKEIDKEIIINFLKTTSFNGLILLYFCHISLIKKKPFSFEDLNLSKGFSKNDYMQGFYIALSSFNLIEATIENNNLIIIELDSTINEHIRQAIYRTANNYDSKSENANNFKWEEDVKLIERFFEF